MPALRNKFESKYKHTLNNFKELSLDSTNNKHLCTNTYHKYCNLDTITEQRCNKQNISTKQSSDTVIFKKHVIYCVEFKNKTMPGVKSKNFKQKIIDTKQTLLDILKELNENYLEYKFIFCAVHNGYNEASQTLLEKEKLQYKYHFQYSNKLEIELDDFNRKKGAPFSKILVEDVDFFRKQFIDKIDQNLPC